MKPTVFAYVCAPYFANSRETGERLRRCSLALFELGYIPICPNLMFTRFLRESIPQQRDARHHMAQQILRRCRVLVVCGDAVTEEMESEIMLAKRLGIVSTTLMGLQAISDFTQEDGQEE